MRFKHINIYGRCSVVHDRVLTVLLRNDSAHVSELYERLLKYYDNDHCKQLNIACDTGAEKVSLHPSADGFAEAVVPFRTADYGALTDTEKSRFWLETIQLAICHAADLWGWDMSVFTRVAQAVEDAGVVNCWRYGRAAGSPDKLYTAAVWVEQDIRSTRIFLVLQKSRTEVQRILLKETEPPAHAYMQWLGCVEWEDVQNILVRRKNDGKVLFHTLLTETETL